MKLMKFKKRDFEKISGNAPQKEQPISSDENDSNTPTKVEDIIKEIIDERTLHYLHYNKKIVSKNSSGIIDTSR